MAKTWIKAEKQFSRRIGAQMVVGHPKHPDPRGRVAEVDDNEALNRLVTGGYAKRISKAEYQRALEGGAVSAGDNMIAQVGGKAPKASVTMTDGQLAQLADQRGVDISKATSRQEVVKLINAKKIDVSADDLPKDAFARTSGDTRDTTLHPPRTGTQADVTEAGTADRLGFSRSGFTDAAGESGLEIDDDAAPRGSRSATTAASTGTDAGATKPAATRSSSSRRSSSRSSTSRSRSSGAKTGSGASTAAAQGAQKEAAKDKVEGGDAGT